MGRYITTTDHHPLSIIPHPPHPKMSARIPNMSARNPYVPAAFPSPWELPGPDSIAPLQHRFPSHSTTKPAAAVTQSGPYSAPCGWRAVYNPAADIPVLIDNILEIPPAPQRVGEIEMADTGSADEAWATWAIHEDLEKVTVDLQVKRPVLAEQVCMLSGR